MWCLTCVPYLVIVLGWHQATSYQRRLTTGFDPRCNESEPQLPLILTILHSTQVQKKSLIYILDIDMFHVANVSHVVGITLFGTAHVFHVYSSSNVCAPLDSAFLPFKPSKVIGSVYE